MIKNCILILVVGLIMLGSGDRQVRLIEQVGEDSRETSKIGMNRSTIHQQKRGTYNQDIL